MATTFTKIAFSECTDGRGILVNDDASVGKLIHEGPSDTDQTDEIWIYAANYDSSDRLLTIEWGSAAAGDKIISTIATQAGLVLVVPGLILEGNATELEVRAFAATTTAIQLFGYVNRIDVSP